jgi:hypothetical protein
MNMKNGKYYTGAERDGNPNSPILILGYILDGKRVEIYKNQETYFVVNTKTAKYLMCMGFEHAHHVFKECVRTLVPEAGA